MKEKTLRVRCTDEEYARFMQYGQARMGDFSAWARVALEYCRNAEQQGRLDLRQYPPTERPADAEDTLRILSRLIDDARKPAV
jgi:hypothetical protein